MKKFSGPLHRRACWTVEGDPGHHGHAGRNRQLFGDDFVTHHPDGFWPWSNEAHSSRFACGGEFPVLAQKTISRVDRIGSRLLRYVDDFIDPQVRLDGSLAAANQVGLIGFVPMLMSAVFLAVDRDSRNPKLVARSEDPDRDFSSIGAQHFFDGLD